MFDIGPEKLLVVGFIAFTVLGPERMPQVARGLGKARAELRRLTKSVHPDALRSARDPRQALLSAVAEPLRAVHEAVDVPRLALADAIADFKFAGADASADPGVRPTGAPVRTDGPLPTPDDPTLN